MKCKICSSKVQTTFLDKLLGTYIKDKSGKRQVVCFECQQKFKTKEEILSHLQ